MMKPLLDQLDQRILGQDLSTRLLVTALIADGHVLLEGVPGLGKTMMVRTLANLADVLFRRVQFTPDMMPSDITGNVIYNAQVQKFEMMKGPVFTNLLLADEINRTPPKTQAALLEAMEERQVTIHGETYALPDPFFVVATQNPVEYEGTYTLPEAQLDRFLMKIVIDYPSETAEQTILTNHKARGSALPEAIVDGTLLKAARQAAAEIKVEEAMYAYVTKLIRATRESDSIQLGASPRAGIALIAAARAWAYMEQRDFITPDDVKIVARPVLRHRLILTPQVELEGGTCDELIAQTLASIPVPR